MASGWDAAVADKGEVSAYNHPQYGLRIMYRGPKDSLYRLGRIPGIYMGDGFLDLPMTYSTALAVETLGEIEVASKRYSVARDACVADFDRIACLYPPPHPLDPRPPYKNQVQCFVHAASRLREKISSGDFAKSGFGFGVFAEQGMGKTKTGVDITRFLLEAIGPLRSCLVLSRKVAGGQWREAFIGGGIPDRNIHRLIGPVEKRKKEMDAARRLPGFHVFIVNWQVVVSMGLHKLEWGIVIADEVHRIKDPSTKVTKALIEMVDERRVTARLGLTGTPCGESPADLWTIMKFCDESIYDCARTRFVQKYCELGGFTGFDPVGYVPEEVADLIEKTYRGAFRATKAASTDIPKKRFEVVTLKPTEKQASAYRQMAKKMYADTEDGRKVKTDNALTRILRLEQITNGFLPVVEVEGTGKQVPAGELVVGDQVDMSSLGIPNAGGEALARQILSGDDECLFDVAFGKEEIDLDEDLDETIPEVDDLGLDVVFLDHAEPVLSGNGAREGWGRQQTLSVKRSNIWLGDHKMDHALEFIAEKHDEDPTSRFIIWRKFRFSLDKTYEAAVEKFGEAAVGKIDGRTKELDRDELRIRFNDRHSKIFLLIIQEQAGCESISLDSADWLLYLCSVHSPIRRLQSEDRGNRLGRTRPYFIVDYVYEDTVDMIGLKASMQRKSVQKIVATEGFHRGLERRFEHHDTPAIVEDSRNML